MVQFYTEDETVKAVKKLISRKMFNLAKVTLHEGLRTFTDSKALRYLSGHIASETRDFFTASRIFEELLEEDPGSVELLSEAARALAGTGNSEKAIDLTRQVMKKARKQTEGLLAIADIYERNNRPEDAEEILQQLSEDQQNTAPIKAMMVRILIAKKKYAEAVDLILGNQDLVESFEEGIFKGVGFFMLSKAYDRLGEYDKAWEAATHAHDLDETPFDEDQFFAQFEEMRDFMTKEIFEALPEGPKTSLEPLFVVGNPRSGTSLLEQILSMHPDIENGGEMSIGMAMQIEVSSLTDSFHAWPTNLIDLRRTDAEILSQDYCDATDYFSGGKKVVSNKALNLPTQVGFLSKVLPSSKAIMLHRHPLDNAVSCYTTNLLSAGHIYTNSLNSLGRVWVERKKMADMWLELLQIPVMELHYENLVSDQRGETERIIEFLDLPWQEDCMEFHKSKYVARTISYDQVNRKMYSSSSGRWKNYEKHLGPVIDAVSDYI
jgi:tetratricopeptide (TPR) repeat protein